LRNNHNILEKKAINPIVQYIDKNSFECGAKVFGSSSAWITEKPSFSSIEQMALSLSTTVIELYFKLTDVQGHFLHFLSNQKNTTVSIPSSSSRINIS
ncbi:hypothetical protein LCGC14_2574240, partial [marine sediment metagenome]